MRARMGALFVFVVAAAVAACSVGVDKKTEASAIVDAARWTVETFKTGHQDTDQLFRANLATAQGVLIFPTVTKAAFFVGAEGGTGVLLVRQEDGSWSYPAFYTIGGGSFGLQAGGVASEMALILRSPGAVSAVLNEQFKLGGNMQMVAGNFGAGLAAATTSNVGADVVGFSRGQGVFAGVALDGAVIARRPDLNAQYYGAGATPTAIVKKNAFANPQAEPLRQALVTD